MSYRDFTLKSACQAFALQIDGDTDLHAAVPEVAPSPTLRYQLEEYAPLGLAVGTDKARSEMIIAPVLAEVRRRAGRRISLFSGTEFDVDPDKGLQGACDFFLSGSQVQLFVEAPVLVMVAQAKNEDMNAGMGECAAALVAARLFNDREGGGPAAIHGAVTMGNLWRFLKLEDETLFIDRELYPLSRVKQILGILMHCVRAEPGEAA